MSDQPEVTPVAITARTHTQNMIERVLHDHPSGALTWDDCGELTATILAIVDSEEVG